MDREIDLKLVSDGRLYGNNDMVKADTHDCKGCAGCCYSMGYSIVLDPLDVARICHALNTNFNVLLQNRLLELGVVDGIILPHLKMKESDSTCVFLGPDERCSIHKARPGFCRMFPLGRIYENHSFKYFLQVNECACQNRGKIKVSKWIDIPNVKENDEFIIHWHYFLRDIQERLKTETDPELAKNISMYILNTFFIFPFNPEQSLYDQYYARANLCANLYDGIKEQLEAQKKKD